MTTYRYSVEILHLLVSSGHAYFGRANDGAASVPTSDLDRVEVVAGKGIVGDRFFGKAAHMDAAVTLMAVESLEAIAAELDVEPFDPLLTRRNAVLRGAHLAPLIGEEFALESRGEIVRLRGGRHAHPCVRGSRPTSSGYFDAPRLDKQPCSVSGFQHVAGPGT
jgi:MOSC domain-containing protein YiiM